VYITISQETLKQALEGKSDRIVLGGRHRTLVVVLLGFWLGAAALFGIFGVSMNSAVPGGVGSSFLIFYIGALAALAVCCYLMGGSSSRLTVDIPSRTFLHEYGLSPIIVRHRGSLDEFEHVSVAIYRTSHFSGATRQNGLLLQLVPKESASPSVTGRKPASTGEPLALHLYDCQRPEEVEGLATMLAQTLGLPFAGETTKIVPPGPMPAWVWKTVGAIIVGVICLLFIYDWYEGRGPRFPVRYGETMVINHRMGDCMVRSLLVTMGSGHRVSGGGGEFNNASSIWVVPYSITLDIENVSSKNSQLNFVVGFSGTKRKKEESGPIMPQAHRKVTVELETSGDPPKDLFLREED
jgi:hypothetical protein